MKFAGQYNRFDHPVEHPYKSAPLVAHRFETGKAGKHLLIITGVHSGTEPFPTYAAQTLIEMILGGHLMLAQGTLTIIPMCNPLAFEKKERFVDSNLNRVMKHHETPEKYEHVLANIITPYIEASDVMIDLHTQSTFSPPFMFNDFPDVAGDLAYSLGIENLITGWEEVYAGNPEYTESDTAGRYASVRGIPSVCVECGNNLDPMSVQTALKTMILGLRYCGLINAQLDFTHPQTFKTAVMKDSLVMPKNAAFTRVFNNFEAVEKDTPLLKTKDNGAIIAKAPFDCLLVLPKIWAEPGMEAFFFAVEENARER